MIEQYRGYEIKVYWSNIEQGYVFCIFTNDGTGIIESNVSVSYTHLTLPTKLEV